MIKLTDILNEAPIGTYATIGDFEKGASYKDLRITYSFDTRT
jgi:hypothetical protein